jgi:hypothetical protein
MNDTKTTKLMQGGTPVQDFLMVGSRTAMQYHLERSGGESWSDPDGSTHVEGRRMPAPMQD